MTMVQRYKNFIYLDFGWFYLIAGFLLVASAMILPEIEDRLRAEMIYHDLESFSEYQDDLEDSYGHVIKVIQGNDRDALKRLEAIDRGFLPGQLRLVNHDLVPSNAESWILQRHALPSLTDIEASLPKTLLMHICCGEKRLWIIGGGSFLMLVGMTMGSSQRS